MYSCSSNTLIFVYIKTSKMKSERNYLEDGSVVPGDHTRANSWAPYSCVLPAYLSQVGSFKLIAHSLQTNPTNDVHSKQPCLIYMQGQLPSYRENDVSRRGISIQLKSALCRSTSFDRIPSNIDKYWPNFLRWLTESLADQKWVRQRTCVIVAVTVKFCLRARRKTAIFNTQMCADL